MESKGSGYAIDPLEMHYEPNHCDNEDNVLPANLMPAKKSPTTPKRFTMMPLGPGYQLLLNADAWNAGRTPNEQAKSLLQARLQAREEMIRARVDEVARMVGMDEDELWRRVSSGEDVQLEGFPECVRDVQSPEIEE